MFLKQYKDVTNLLKVGGEEHWMALVQGEMLKFGTVDHDQRKNVVIYPSGMKSRWQEENIII